TPGRDVPRAPGRRARHPRVPASDQQERSAVRRALPARGVADQPRSGGRSRSAAAARAALVARRTADLARRAPEHADPSGTWLAGVAGEGAVADRARAPEPTRVSPAAGGDL